MWVIPTMLPRQKSGFSGVSRVCRIRVRIRVSFSCANLIFRRSVAVWIIPDWINTVGFTQICTHTDNFDRLIEQTLHAL